MQSGKDLKALGIEIGGTRCTADCVFDVNEEVDLEGNQGWIVVIDLRVTIGDRRTFVCATLCDTLALATGTRVGASDHAIDIIVFCMVVSLGF